MKPNRVLGKAISAARKKVRILPRKKLNQNLSFCCGDLADAYEVGVREAQMDIVDRLLALEAKLQRAAQPPGDGWDANGSPIGDVCNGQIVNGKCTTCGQSQ